MLFNITYAFVVFVNASNNKVKSIGNWYVYGDVSEDNSVNISDVIIIM